MDTFLNCRHPERVSCVKSGPASTLCFPVLWPRNCKLEGYRSGVATATIHTCPWAVSDAAPNSMPAGVRAPHSATRISTNSRKVRQTGVSFDLWGHRLAERAPRNAVRTHGPLRPSNPSPARHLQTARVSRSSRRSSRPGFVRSRHPHRRGAPPRHLHADGGRSRHADGGRPRRHRRGL